MALQSVAEERHRLQKARGLREGFEKLRAPYTAQRHGEAPAEFVTRQPRLPDLVTRVLRRH